MFITSSSVGFLTLEVGSLSLRVSVPKTDLNRHVRCRTGVLRAQHPTVPTAPPMRLPIPNPNPKTHPNPKPYFNPNPNPFLKENKNDTGI